MPIRTMQNIASSYAPSGRFSFEFRKRNGRPLTEIFFLLPPQQYSISEGFRVSIRPTLSGGHVDDFGNDFKTITLSGEIYSYWEGQAGVFTLDGATDAYRMRYALSRFRDFFHGKRTVSPVSTIDTLALETLSQSDTRYDNLDIYYHDYDDNQHFRVVIESFTISRGQDDPFTTKYSIQMRALEDVAQAPIIPRLGALAKLSPLGLANALYGDFLEFQAELAAYPAIYQQALRSVVDVVADTIAMSDKIGDFLAGGFASYANPVRDLVEYATMRVSTMPDGTPVAKHQWFREGAVQLIAMLHALSATEAEDAETDLTDRLPSTAFEMVDTLNRTSSAYAEVPALVSISGDFSQDFGTRIASEGNVSNQEKLLRTEDFTRGSTTGTRQGQLFPIDGYYYTVMAGDTPQSISIALFRTAEMSDYILLANRLSYADFEADSMVGKTILIPGKVKSREKQNRNLVYSPPISPLASLRERVYHALGIDIYLDEDGNLEVDGSGDIRGVYGVDCLAQNLMDRIMYPKLNDEHPEWGLQLSAVEVPPDIMQDKFRREALAQILGDPRVDSATIQNLIVEGDTVRIQVSVVPVIGESRLISAEVPIMGQ